jgi:hypothetical protein
MVVSGSAIYCAYYHYYHRGSASGSASKPYGCKAKAQNGSNGSKI